MDKFLQYLKGKSIHIVGVTGAEGSSILRFLIAYAKGKITAHDFLGEDSVEKSFKLWHKGVTTLERQKLFLQFKNDLAKTVFYSDKDYLKNITSADIIFVPQSWRLYKAQNRLLWQVKKANVPFYSLTRLYLDFSPAYVVGVTGTVGKGSVANILVQLLKKGGKRVYFAGNETWRVQVTDKLKEMTSGDILVLEISHRQLQDGYARAPQIVIFTNLYPNHLDELNWEEYKKLKLSLVLAQNPAATSVLNYDSPELRKIVPGLKSKVIFYSEEQKKMNTKNIQGIYEEIMNRKSIHYPINILAASTAADILGINREQIMQSLSALSALPARLEHVATISGVKFYDDIKSTTPWATLAGIKKLNGDTIVICGGKTKGMNYQDFSSQAKKLVKYLIILKSQMSQFISKYLPDNIYTVANNLDEAVKIAYQKTKAGDNILISPGAGFFYTDFIKGKLSLRKLIISLLPKGQAVMD